MRATVTVLVAVLAWGGLQHLLDFATGGLTPYAYAPTWLGAYWSALLVLDPLAAYLLARARRAGVVLAVAILVSDAAANGYAVHALGLGGPLAPAGQALVSVLALAALVMSPRLMRAATALPNAASAASRA